MVVVVVVVADVDVVVCELDDVRRMYRVRLFMEVGRWLFL